MAKLQHLKASRTKILTSLPTKSFGNDGDIVMSKISGRGVYLCSKVNGTWYAANKLQELSSIENSSINKLATKKLSIKGLINASENTDKFIVSDFGNLKYRTGNQVVEDLGLPSVYVEYKTSYCSLGQYTDKDSCESSGGTWYYSENDSHDSISSTAENQLLTVGQSIGKLDSESNLLYDGSTLEIKRNTNYDDNWQTSAQTNLLKLTYDSSNSAIFDVDSSGNLTLDSAGLVKLDAEDFDAEEGVQFLLNGTKVGDITGHHSATYLTLYENIGASTNDNFNISCGANGATSISTVDAAAAAGHLTLAPDGDLVLDPFSNKIIINATDKLYFDGGSIGNTYIHEASADVVRHVVGDDILMALSESGDDGNEVRFDSCVGFVQKEPTYDATDTEVDFRFSNKQFVTFGSGNITNLKLTFPLVSGNFVVLLKQDGTGSRTVTNYKVFEFDESAADGHNAVKFAGGSNPTLTTDANHVDIISIYWDADNEIAYGVATLDFQF